MSPAAVSREQEQHFRQIITLNVLVSVILEIPNACISDQKYEIIFI